MADDLPVDRPLSVAVASGKGGTGKTLVATGLAVLAAETGARVTLVDCDAETPNDHLFLPRTDEMTSPVTVPVAHPHEELCTGCGTCRDVCTYGAARVLGGKAMVFEELCHGCGMCTRECPNGAMWEMPARVGEVTVGPVGDHDRLTLVSGRLDVGHVKTPAVIRQAREIAATTVPDLTICDAPPGVACAAVAAVRAADLLLLVTEPTPFGVHDLRLAHRLGRELGIPMGIIVNRDAGIAGEIDDLAAEWDVPIVARIPFDRAIAEKYATGRMATELPGVAAAVRDTLGALSNLAAPLDDEGGMWS